MYAVEVASVQAAEMIALLDAAETLIAEVKKFNVKICVLLNKQ